MGLFKRIQDILSANMNEMVDGFEEPEKMLKQAIREMEDAIEQSKKETAKAMANDRLVQKDLADNQAQRRRWHDQAERAVRAGDDDAARTALLRKQELDKVGAALQDQGAASAESSATLRRQLEAMQAKLAEAKRTLGTLKARAQAAQARQNLANPDFNQEAFAKFDRIRDKVAYKEAEADALRELDGSSADQDLETSVDRAEVDAELEKLKRVLGK